MRTQKTIETVTCDICGRECKPVLDLHFIYKRECGDPIAKKTHFHFDARPDEDICQPCLQNMLRKGPVFFTVENG